MDAVHSAAERRKLEVGALLSKKDIGFGEAKVVAVTAITA